MNAPFGMAQAVPPTINHVVASGNNRRVVEQLKTALAAYWNERAAGRECPFGSVLLVGPKGTGKTTLAKVLAAELATTRFVDVLGQILTPEDLRSILMEATSDTLVFIDEGHLANAFCQHMLLRALEDRQLHVPVADREKRFVSVPLNNFTLVLATTDEYGLIGPLRDRMRLTLRLSFYSDEELELLTHQRAHMLGWKVEPEVCHSIAALARNTPRAALRLLENCLRTSRAEAAEMITMAHFHRTLELEGLDGELGLDQTERAYLTVLAEAGDGQAVRVNVLATRLGLPMKTLCDVTEDYLVRAGLVMRAPAGRELTDKGRAYIQRNYAI